MLSDRERGSLRGRTCRVLVLALTPFQILRILPSDPVQAYRSLVHLTPNPSQRRILASAVFDLPLWQQTLEHWLLHGWNPRNITGMLELYGRGGASGCRHCRHNGAPNKVTGTALQNSLASIEAVRKKQRPLASHD